MKIIRKIINKLFYSVCFKLRPYEEDCIRHWYDTLEEEAKKLLSKQLAYFDMYSRQSKCKLVLFEKMNDRSCRLMPQEYLFPFKAATVVCRMKLYVQNECNSEYIAEISTYDGRLFSIDFDSPPVIGNNKYRIENVVIVYDLLKDYKPKDSAASTLAFKDYLGKMHFDEEAPADEWCKGVLDKLDIEVPSDYLAFVSQSSYFEFADCEIYQPDKIEKIVTPNENVYLLARIYEKGAIGVLKENDEFKLSYFDNELDGPYFFHDSFLNTIINLPDREELE